MNYTTIATLDGTYGVLAISDRGFASNNYMYVLDNPVIKLDFTGSGATSVRLWFEDSGGDTVAEWTIDDTLKVNYIEIGDVLRYAVQPPTLSADTTTETYSSLVLYYETYDSNSTTLVSSSRTYKAYRSSKYTSLGLYADYYPSLPSRFRMQFSSVWYYDYTKYNIVAIYPRSYAMLRFYNGNTTVDTKGGVPHRAWNRLVVSTPITSAECIDVNTTTVIERATVEVPSCAGNVIALKWWSRIGGCWKSIVLDVVGSGYTNDNTIDYWTDLTEDQLKSGTTYVSGRFPNATYKDYLYYSDIIMGEHITASMPVIVPSGYHEDVPVKVSGSWSYKQNDIKDMDFTITIKTYDIDD